MMIYGAFPFTPYLLDFGTEQGEEVSRLLDQLLASSLSLLG